MCLYSEWGTNRRVVGGIPFEIARRTVAAGCGWHDNSNFDFEIEGLKLILEQMSSECSCDILYHSLVVDAVTERGSVTGVAVQNKSGSSTIRARRTIDCTGDGDVAAAAGCRFEKGDPESGCCQPMTLMFTVGGVQWDQVKAWRTDYKM